MSNSTITPQPALAYETPRSQWNSVTIGAVALRIIGVYCFIEAVPVVGLVFYLVSSVTARMNYTLMQLIGSFVMYGIDLALAFTLIMYADGLARWLFRGEPAQAAAESHMEIGPYLQAVAFSVLGVWVSIEAMGSMAYFIADHAARGTSATVGLAGPIVKLALGIFLIFRGPALALFWHKIRTSGTIHEARL